MSGRVAVQPDIHAFFCPICILFRLGNEQGEKRGKWKIIKKKESHPEPEIDLRRRKNITAVPFSLLLLLSRLSLGLRSIFRRKSEHERGGGAAAAGKRREKAFLLLWRKERREAPSTLPSTRRQTQRTEISSRSTSRQSQNGEDSAQWSLLLALLVLLRRAALSSLCVEEDEEKSGMGTKEILEEGRGLEM